jgi:hypothetical protein
MKGQAIFMPNDIRPLKQRLSTIFYLSAIAVAMVGWLSVFGWGAVAVARWLWA